MTKRIFRSDDYLYTDAVVLPPETPRGDLDRLASDLAVYAKARFGGLRVAPDSVPSEHLDIWWAAQVRAARPNLNSSRVRVIEEAASRLAARTTASVSADSLLPTSSSASLPSSPPLSLSSELLSLPAASCPCPPTASRASAASSSAPPAAAVAAAAICLRCLRRRATSFLR